MYYTGFADEAGPSIEEQIEATKALGWSDIESRNIDGKNIHDIPDGTFDEVAAKLEAAGIRINCFGSAVANWAKDPTSDEDFERSKAELTRALKRMALLNTPMIRGMSFKIFDRTGPCPPEVERQVFEKVRYLVGMCEDAGVLYVHENCMNYGGMSYENTLKLVEAVDSPHFKLVFDTGNPVNTNDYRGEPPYAKQSAWEFYRNVREHVHYVHIKDAVFEEETGGTFPKARFTFPGEGDGDVKRIVADLLATGYDGGFSMEPHMEAVFHEDASPEGKAKARFDNYVEYGRRFEKLVAEARP